MRVCTPRLASGAKNIDKGAGMGNNMLIRAKNTEFGAGKGKNLPIRAENAKIGAAPSKTSYYSAEIPAE